MSKALQKSRQMTFAALPLFTDVVTPSQKAIRLVRQDLPSFHSSCTLAFLTPSLHNQAASLYSSQDTCPSFHCLCISFLPFSLTSRSQLIHTGPLPSFPDFLHLGIESSCTLWKASLKICQLCSAPLSLRAVSQGVLLTNSLKSWKFAFLKFKPRLLAILTSPISSLALVTNRSSIASPLIIKNSTFATKPGGIRALFAVTNAKVHTKHKVVYANVSGGIEWIFRDCINDRSNEDTAQGVGDAAGSWRQTASLWAA
ncbi:hypothetical protein QYF61_010037 [Mycteria americana]|uniref:Uncharacterized protein n=1 Tax=Mycteria americana TaxID=33587 RepID=A0AAN7RVH9_MYCAM|nr:hypothetical protein QYF61_010037 [Mycteria americana]